MQILLFLSLITQSYIIVLILAIFNKLILDYEFSTS